MWGIVSVAAAFISLVAALLVYYFLSLDHTYLLPWKMATSTEKKDEGKSWESATSIYDFSAKDIDGTDVSLEKYKGFVTLIVNVASE